MNKELNPSDSTEQQLAQVEVLSFLNSRLTIKLEAKSLAIGKTKFQIDGYSDIPPVLCEIYSRVEETKSSQKNKVCKDILKMLLIEKMQNKTFRKIIAFADDEAAKSFSSGESWYSKLKDHFNIEIIIIDISSQLRESLINAQKRQYR